MLNLFIVNPKLSCSPRGGEAQHQRVRERPRLAPKVADVLHLDADFFKYLAPDALLNRFPRLHETGKNAVKLALEARGACQEQLSFPNHCNNHGRSQSRVLAVTARIASCHRLALRHRGRCATGGTIPTRLVPIDDLNRPAEQAKLNLADVEVKASVILSFQYADPVYPVQIFGINRERVDWPSLPTRDLMPRGTPLDDLRGEALRHRGEQRKSRI